MHNVAVPAPPAKAHRFAAGRQETSRFLPQIPSPLELAQQAVREQHARLEHLPLDSPPSLPSSELLAEIVVERSAELSDWIQRYNQVIDHMLDEHDDLF
jgi:hypothetical protein